jgi:hypothetical protein
VGTPTDMPTTIEELRFLCVVCAKGLKEDSQSSQFELELVIVDQNPVNWQSKVIKKKLDCAKKT